LDQEFSLIYNKPLADFELAKKSLGLVTKPVLIGPLTFIYLSTVVGAKDRVESLNALLPKILPLYEEVVRSLVDAGAQWIQVDEPIFATTLTLDGGLRSAYHAAFASAASKLQSIAGFSARLIFATYFNSIVTTDNLPIVTSLPPGSGLHIDLVRGKGQVDEVLAFLPSTVVLSLGVVDGRNVWLTPLAEALVTVNQVVSKLGWSRVLISSSCSCLHVPHSLEAEYKRVAANKPVVSPKSDTDHAIRVEVLPWLSFGIEKVRDIVTLAGAISKPNDDAIVKALATNAAAISARKSSKLLADSAVASRIGEMQSAGLKKFYRQSPYEKRIQIQQEHLKLPLIPTTTIGSFPQTADVRSARAKFRAGRISEEEYTKYIQDEIKKCIKIQEDIGLDVLVHGEFERTDMVEFFAEYLSGFLVTENGWVQSYGTRCVKPAILYGDVSRPIPMTVDVAVYAQSLSSKPVKGMLTGPTTILQWSFIRNDQPYAKTNIQVAMAIRDEVNDLEAAGIKVIQVDEPGFREGLPLDADSRYSYLNNVVECFKLATGGVRDNTQIHTHMCYSDFKDIFEHVAALDADVLSIECSRSDLQLLNSFASIGYPLSVGPGLYDIHSPRVPTQEELQQRFSAMAKIIPSQRLWANPDCGLKTRAWPETEAALRVLVNVAKEARSTLQA
jgi:5-methyltetrahydropteroyltriglutamate--homocysteine methyltransferase